LRKVDPTLVGSAEIDASVLPPEDVFHKVLAIQSELLKNALDEEEALRCVVATLYAQLRGVQGCSPELACPLMLRALEAVTCSPPPSLGPISCLCRRGQRQRELPPHRTFLSTEEVHAIGQRVARRTDPMFAVAPLSSESETDELDRLVPAETAPAAGAGAGSAESVLDNAEAQEEVLDSMLQRGLEPGSAGGQLR
jgi:hypothetical protein